MKNTLVFTGTVALLGSSPEGEGGADHHATEEDKKFTGATMGEVGETGFLKSKHEEVWIFFFCMKPYAV